MNLAYWCILIAGLLPVLTVGIAKAQRGYDNSAPRAWLEKQQGLHLRADYAHRNHFEAFPFFAAAVLVAAQMHTAQHTIDTFALVFIAARIAYTICYLTNLAALRSICWAIGYFSVVGLFIAAAGLI